MPVVIKRDETGKDPKKDPKAKAAPDPKAAKPAKPAKPAKTAADATPKAKKTAGGAAPDTRKIVMLSTITVLALGFFVWYVFIFNAPHTEPPLPADPVSPLTSPPVPNQTAGSAGGISTGEKSPIIGKKNFLKATEGQDSQPEGIR